MADIVNLRPQHLDNLLIAKKIGDIILSMFKYRPWRMAARKERYARRKFRKTHGDSAWAEVESIDAKLSNPEIFVRIVRGGDDICAKCLFAERCLRGDYSEVRKAYEGEWRVNYKPVHNPVIKDDLALKRRGLSYGEILSTGQLNSKRG